jgi:hypothetical protein
MMSTAVDVQQSQREKVASGANHRLLHEYNSTATGKFEVLGEHALLAENVHLLLLNSLCQFRAFAALPEKTKRAAETPAAIVLKQHPKLASIAPTLLEVYAKDAMELHRLIPFTAKHDHAPHVQLWDFISSFWSKELFHIYHMLPEAPVRNSKRRAVFQRRSIWSSRCHNAAMEKIDFWALVLDQPEISRAGLFVTLDRYGALSVCCGHMRLEIEHGQEMAV